jgi:hypothetical protein
MNAVTSHAFGCSSSPTNVNSRSERRTSPTGLLIASASLNTTDTSAAKNQSTADQDAVRSAAYAPTSSTPDFLGATMNAANSNDPTVSTLPISARTRVTVRPYTFTRPVSPAVRESSATAVRIASSTPMKISGRMPAVVPTRAAGGAGFGSLSTDTRRE